MFQRKLIKIADERSRRDQRRDGGDEGAGGEEGENTPGASGESRAAVAHRLYQVWSSRERGEARRGIAEFREGEARGVALREMQIRGCAEDGCQGEEVETGEGSARGLQLKLPQRLARGRPPPLHTG
eukprot:766209-Hanusia_phi.AAC.3